MSRRTASAAAVAAVLTGLAVVPLTAGAADPVLTVHPIFSGGAKAFHVGAVVQVGARGRRDLARICFAPAPIDRPACSTSLNGAPSRTGTTKVTVTFKDGATASMRIRVRPAAKTVGGPVPVPGHITCPATGLYGSPSGNRDRTARAARNLNVALYNRIGGRRFVWIYRTNGNGFANVNCLARGLIPIGG